MGVELAYLLDRKPATLSGGEKQRVALGRCITRDARVFLVDEPFANLDQAMREKYRVNLKMLLQQFDITTVYVTHDHQEALILADLIAVMDRGHIEQVGTPQQLYDEPRNVFVAGFLNLHTGSPPISLLEAAGMPGVDAPAGALLGVRPEDVEVTAADGGGLTGVVREILAMPPLDVRLLTIRVSGHDVHARVTGGAVQRGDRVRLGFRRYHLFDKPSGARLRSRDAR
jgi:ABC-type sugar transport system ATPase subunit